GTVAYLSAPGLVEQFAHPVPGGDVCTAIALDPGLLASLAGRDPVAATGVLRMDAASELAMRSLTVMARRGDPDGSLAEHVIGFAASLLARRRRERTGGGRPATAAAGRRVVSQAQAALAADPRLGLVPLSRVNRLLAAPPQARVHPAHPGGCEPVPEPAAGQPGAGAGRRGRARPRRARRGSRLRRSRASEQDGPGRDGPHAQFAARRIPRGRV